MCCSYYRWSGRFPDTLRYRFRHAVRAVIRRVLEAPCNFPNSSDVGCVRIVLLVPPLDVVIKIRHGSGR